MVATLFGLMVPAGVALILGWFIPASAAGEWQSGAGCRFMAVEPGGPSAAAPSPTPFARSGFEELSAVRAGIRFTNALPVLLMAENNNLMNGSGVAAGDFDGDGWCDLYFCAINGANVLYRNLGSWRFQEVALPPELQLTRLHSTGAVFADIDGDGALDLLVATLGSGVHCFVNQGGGRFQETTAQAGLASKSGSTSLALGDVDGDGDLDLYVANYGALSILRSGGRADVQMVNGQWVVTGPHAARLRLVNGRLEEVGEPDLLYRNDGHGHFQAMPWSSEFFLDEEGQPKPAPWDYGLSVQIRDLNGDGLPDIYVCNDFQTLDRIWLNTGAGHFRALARLALRKQSFSAMGVDFADLDRDGFFDFAVTEMTGRTHVRRMRDIVGMQPEPPIPGLIENRPEVGRNTLYRNRGDQTFAEIAHFAGVSATDWSWQPVFLDVDLDGYEDLLVANGMPYNVQDRDTLNRIRSLGKQSPEQSRTNLLLYPPHLTPNVAFRNRGDLTFADQSAAWRFDSRRISQGVALADFDHDGDLDIVINCLNDAPLLYRNAAIAPRVGVRLLGKGLNRAGVGSLIRVFGGAVPSQMQEILCGGYYLSGSDPLRMFAAGSLTNDLSIEVRWANGKQSRLSAVKANRVYAIEEPAGPAMAANSSGPSISPPRTLFRDASRLLGHGHHEELFNDFSRQPLLMKLLSQSGPGVAWFDLDGDGHDELVLGTGRGGALEVFRGTGNGQFEKIKAGQPSPTPDDLTGLAGWVTADGRRSVLTGLANYESGLTNVPAVFRCSLVGQPAALDVRPLEGVGPEPWTPGPLAVADLDGDGDLDLFVGGRVQPGAYPAPVPSRIYRQDQSGLIPEAAAAGILNEAGLVSGAVWSDLNGDGFPELILACEWGPIKIFLNEKGRLRAWDAPVTLEESDSAVHPQSTTLGQFTGWWSGVTTGDFDEDGLPDIIATNWGRNDAYQASGEHPLRLYYGDLAGTGNIDLIESYYAPELNKDVPRRTLHALSQAFPPLVASFPTHEAFSLAGVADVLRVLGKPAPAVTAVTLSTTLFLNRRTHFIARPLPAEAQFAPAFAAVVADANGDGHDDLFLSQNFFAMRPEWPRLDGGRGLWLQGDGTGRLAPIPGQEAGVAGYGEQRGAAAGDFNEDGRIDLVVTQNGAATRLFENVGGRPGLRVRLRGPTGNPFGIGSTLRLERDGRLGPARELHGGSGYWSQDSPVQILGGAASGRRLHVRWPGGQTVVAAIPDDSLEVIVEMDGRIQKTKVSAR